MWSGLARQATQQADIMAYWKTWMEYKTENYETNNVWMKDTHVGAFGIWIIYIYDKII